MSGTIGNTNATKGKPWRDAINRALARRAEDHTVEGGLNTLADKFLAACEEGDQWAMKELGDRVEGKAAQSHTLGNEDGEEFKVRQTVELIPLANDNITDSDTE